MKKLAIITTHPIQYNAPLFRLLTSRSIVEIKVFYTWGDSVLSDKYDPGFGKVIQWDIPLLEGYEYAFVTNTSGKPGSDHFRGIINPDLITDISAWKADAILVFGWSFKSHLGLLSYFHGKLPVYFRGDSTLLDEENGLVKKIVRCMALRWVYKHVDIALYVGQANKAYFKKFGLKENQLLFVPHAIDNDRFGIAEVDGQIRATLSIPFESVVFLFAGKLEPKKNPALFVKAFMQLKDHSAHLILAGNGVLEESLKLDCEKNKNIHFIPFQNQSQMPGLYKACDVFVLPSQGPGETWGLSVNEAMACGKAVLVSNKCGCAIDLVQNGKNGFIFESGNENDLLSKMDYFLENPTSLKRMGSKSLEMIEEWNYENVCKTLEDLLISRS